MALVLAAAAFCGRVPTAAADGAVYNEAGVPVKLITVRPCRLYERPDPKSKSSPCRPFQFWYVLPLDTSVKTVRMSDVATLRKDGFYRVASGESASEGQGWVAAEDVVEWHHRQALSFAPRAGRKLTSFFATKDQAIAAARSGDVSGAAFREPDATGDALILMPLLSVGKVDVDGHKSDVFQVAFMSGRPGAPETPSSDGAAGEGLPPGLTAESVRKSSTVDIVFVVDTTGSMRRPIEQVRRSIEAVSRSLASEAALAPRLRFGLVCYRDATDPGPDGYVTKVFCDLEAGRDHENFISSVASLEVGGGGDEPEDALAGLAQAMDVGDLKWNPVGWKQIILVADAPARGGDHPDPSARSSAGDFTIARILAMAQPGGGTLRESLVSEFVLSAVHVHGAGESAGLSIAQRQFQRLVSGREYRGIYLDAVQGTPTADFAERLTGSIVERLRAFDRAVIRGDTKAAPAGGSSAEFPYPVLELISKLSAESSPGLMFHSAWCTEFDHEGARSLTPHLFVRKGQLESFNALVGYLQGSLEDAGEPGSRDVHTVVKSLQTVSVSLNLDEPIDDKMELEKLFRALLGIPLKTPIFRLSIADLAAMSQADYDDWVRGVGACKQTLTSFVENPTRWYKLHPLAKAREQHAFIAQTDLP